MILCNIVSGQDRSEDTFRNDHIAGLNGQTTRVIGYLDHSLMVELMYASTGSDCTGIMSIAGQEISLEGECTDSTMSLFEFDEHARVSGVIEGSVQGDAYDLKWSNYDHTLSYYLEGRRDVTVSNLLKVYSIKDESRYDHLLLWPDQLAISVSKDEPTLSWQHYQCPQAPYACQYEKVDGALGNLSISDRVISAGSRLFKLEELLSVEEKDGHDYGHFYNYKYIRLGQSKFDDFIESIIEGQLSSFKNSLPLVNDSEDREPSERLTNRAIGDFYISLISEDIISGYLTFYNTQNPRIETVPFSFDRAKNKFYNLRNIWRKDFNYSYFLKSIIENKKRALIQKEEALVKKMLKDTPFSHFNISSKGMVFFTDHNFVYGRRHILVPFDEITGFISDRSLSNLINDKS